MLKPENAFRVAPDPDRPVDETSEEPFDRIAFARRALDLLRPPRTTVALLGEVTRMRIESGRTWGRKPAERWALLAIPPRASRRAIALAVAEISCVPRAYALDALMVLAEGVSTSARPDRAIA